MILKIISDHQSLCFSTVLVVSSFWGFLCNQLFAHLGWKCCKKLLPLQFHLLISLSDIRWFKSSYTDPDADALSWKQFFGLSVTGLENELVTLILVPKGSKQLGQVDIICFCVFFIYLFIFKESLHFASSE